MVSGSVRWSGDITDLLCPPEIVASRRQQPSSGADIPAPMASHDAMNREDGDADHVAVTQSDMTRATSAALQAAAAQGSASQRPSPGGSATVYNYTVFRYQYYCTAYAVETASLQY